MRGIAFKVTYNDSGANGGLIGYRGVCPDRIIVDNVKHRQMTCCPPNRDGTRKWGAGLFRYLEERTLRDASSKTSCGVWGTTVSGLMNPLI